MKTSFVSVQQFIKVWLCTVEFYRALKSYFYEIHHRYSATKQSCFVDYGLQEKSAEYSQLQLFIINTFVQSLESGEKLFVQTAPEGREAVRLQVNIIIIVFIFIVTVVAIVIIIIFIIIIIIVIIINSVIIIILIILVIQVQDLQSSVENLFDRMSRLERDLETKLVKWTGYEDSSATFQRWLTEVHRSIYISTYMRV